ncbi:sensor domain-containing diguanylate cyclase [Pseudomonas sp. SO81]|uniref:sensor domain-containing diguanylate cyclase n=1 Tax=Pseudomonas sp. SO81 TaxID=2983246 RepID=UPI0025A471FA|nr:sensor domain-containing diguanylate cyclase [Pseudomonas sp. SO81]WJN61498.1 Sensory box histidine kinase [Pseudomonas sp. SO81]
MYSEISSEPPVLHVTARPWSSERYQQGMQHLLHVVQELSLARDLATVQEIVRHAARRLTGCDGATFVLRDGPFCHYADEDAVGPLWKGKRFPLETCISGWAMLNRQQAVIPDIYVDPRIPHDAYRPTFVKSLVMVPIRTREPVGAIGNYWAEHHHPCAEEVQLLQALADSTSIAIENVQLYRSLEQRVEERTRELQEAYDRIHSLSMTDELTGLCNRRGFYLLAEQTLLHAARYGGGCTVMFMDLDGLKQINDRLGHEAGDAMIRQAAEILRRTLREADVAARMGGDEFCVVALGNAGKSLQQRLQQAIAAFNGSAAQPFALSASLGCAELEECAEASLDSLLALADERMYEDKRRRRAGRADR